MSLIIEFWIYFPNLWDFTFFPEFNFLKIKLLFQFYYSSSFCNNQSDLKLKICQERYFVCMGYQFSSLTDETCYQNVLMT